MAMRIVHALTLLSALGCGLVAGIFFAFSTSVMRALAGLPRAQGIAAMRSINVVIINPWFMSAFFGTAVVCILLAITAVLNRHDPGAAYLVAGSLLYLVGSIVVTMAFNVPLNNELARAEPTSEEAGRLWSGYLTTWTRWNHLRVAASLAAAALLTIGLCK